MKISATALTIVCTDLDRSERFYCDVLGAVREARDGFGCRWLQLGGVTLSLMPNAETRSPAEFSKDAMAMLTVEVSDLDDAKTNFARHGVAIVDAGDGNFVLIADPDGIVIEIMQREGK